MKVKNKVSWKRLRKSIPAFVQVNSSLWYDVVWSVDMGKDVGEMNPLKRQIKLQLGLSDKETVINYFHELAHLFSDENGGKLTENQILELEKSFPYLLKPGNIFKQ